MTAALTAWPISPGAAHAPNLATPRAIAHSPAMVPLSFDGRRFFVAGDAALWWPERRALLMADLHLEKGSFYAATGQMLPPYDSHATLDAIAALVARLQPATVYCLGDNFHDDAGEARLAPCAAATLQALTAATDWQWIRGNHDREVSGRWGGRALAEIEVDGLLLRHQAVLGESRPEMSGHFHPKLRMSVRGRRIARRCFVRTPRKLIFPAFGALTGGLDVHHPEIARLCHDGGRGGNAEPAGEALVALADRLACFPLTRFPAVHVPKTVSRQPVRRQA